MESFVWWSTAVVVTLAAAIDIFTRRIPNWLSLPYLAVGIAVSGFSGGPAGLARSLEGIGIAVGVTGILCYLRALGMGDLKLLAAVGAWIGPGQLVMALVVTGMAGGFLAVGYALWRGSLKKALGGTLRLIVEMPRRPFRPHPTLALGHAAAASIPYAPAIALGTMFSFLTR